DSYWRMNWPNAVETLRVDAARWRACSVEKEIRASLKPDRIHLTISAPLRPVPPEDVVLPLRRLLVTLLAREAQPLVEGVAGAHREHRPERLKLRSPGRRPRQVRLQERRAQMIREREAASLRGDVLLSD